MVGTEKEKEKEKESREKEKGFLDSARVEYM